MEYKKVSDSKWIIRVSKGEEIISKVLEFIKEKEIRGGAVSGIGAVNRVEIWVYDTKKKDYIKREYRGDFEIASLLGNISVFENKPVLHIHVVLGDKDNRALAGHLGYGVVSGTCEIVLEEFNTPLKRTYFEKSNLKLLNLKE